MISTQVKKKLQLSYLKYLGQIIQNNGRNDQYIKDKTDKAVRNFRRITNAMSERPYGKHSFKAAVLMRQAMLLGGLLSNAEKFTHLTESGITKLKIQDYIFIYFILYSNLFIQPVTWSPAVL